jgi:hypothetical protein
MAGSPDEAARHRDNAKDPATILLPLMFKLAVLSPAAVCGSVSDPGSITQSYAMMAAPGVPMDSLDDDSASPDGSCASTGETDRQPALEELFTESAYIA